MGLFSLVFQIPLQVKEKTGNPTVPQPHPQQSEPEGFLTSRRGSWWVDSTDTWTTNAAVSIVVVCLPLMESNRMTCLISRGENAFRYVAGLQKHVNLLNVQV